MDFPLRWHVFGIPNKIVFTSRQGDREQYSQKPRSQREDGASENCLDFIVIAG